MSEQSVESLDPREYIIIKGARVHNLKNLDVAIPRNKFVVVTGVSGSGKSSLAFDTLFAEGQRRYVESLSSYARQFLGKMDKPEVDYIRGISPAIAIEQKVITKNPRSTVGTSTEIYDYVKLLFARIGKTFSPVSGQQVRRDTVATVLEEVEEIPEGAKVMLFAPFKIREGKTFTDEIKLLLQQGFSRVSIDGEIRKMEDLLDPKAKIKIKKTTVLRLLIDRFIHKKDDEDNYTRIADSVTTAFFEGSGECLLLWENPDGTSMQRLFSNLFELDGMKFEEPSLHFFSFNNPIGACKLCEGFGSVIGIDEDLVIPNKSVSIYDGAVACWKGEKMGEWKEELVLHAYKFQFPIHKPFYELNAEQKNLLWEGNKYFKGLNQFFKHLEEQSYKIQYRVMLSRFRGKTQCPECRGSRLRKDASYVKIGGKSITDVVLLPVSECLPFFKQLDLSESDKAVAKRILIEIINRLGFLVDVGLGYLTLNRLANTLSGGESQRINLATSLGSSLVGSMYILDEPSIGLHSRDTDKLITVLESLKALGNTVIVVEHDEEIMRASDEIIDIGPEAGILGGNLIFKGDHAAILKEKKSLTARYLNGTMKIEVPASRRAWKNYIEIIGARENNLKNLHIKFPLNVLTVVTGVSGSGKSSLIKKILYPALQKNFGSYGEFTGHFDQIKGDINQISGVEFVDQNPIGKSSRSNPVTYLKAYDEIRNLYSEQHMSKLRGYKPAHFSFNVDGGRCEVCQGEGEVKIEMQFMADIHLVCESCHGKRFKQDILEITYKDKNIADILDLTVDEAMDFFDPSDSNISAKIANRIRPLQDVGLGYVKLGQSSSTLSGGEAQRIKLAFFLIKGNTGDNTLFIFDEPTTGLHFHDIKKLLGAFEALLKQGHSMLIVEHNLDVIKCADWIIDLGPEGGEAGGELIFEGLPEDLVKVKESYTGQYLKEKL